MASRDISQLSDREHCRLRPGTYVGSIEPDEKGRNSESLITIIREATDNSIDEIKLGNGKTVWIAKEKVDKPDAEFEKDVSFVKQWYSYLCGDDCGGIPIKKTIDIKGDEVTMVDLAVSNFRAGSKFDSNTRQDVDFIGMNGIGVSATNFLSVEFSVYSHLSCHSLSETTEYVKSLVKKSKITKSNSEDWYYKASYEFGVKKDECLVRFDEDPILQKFAKQKKKPSTVTWFIPDPQIHGTVDADIPVTFRYMKYLNPEYTFYVNWKEDKDVPKKYQYNDIVKVSRPDCINPKVTFTYSIEPMESLKENPTEDFSCNTLSTQEGVHKRLFDNAWKAAFCSYFENNDIEKYAAIGLNRLCIFQCPEPSFSSQVKEKLASVEGFKANEVLPELVKSFTKIIKSNEDTFRKYYELVAEYLNARQNIGKLKVLKQRIGDMASGKSKSVSSYMPKKLLDCPCKDRSKAEVFYVEGDSAAGGFVKARAGLDNIAVMPLRGKVLNTADISIDKAMENAEIYDITNISGGVDDLHLDVKKLHFSKFIIATDADSDGLQIGALLLCDLVKNHSFLFGTAENDYKDSMVYYAQAPLFAFTQVDGTKKDVFFYAGQEAEVAEFQKNHKYKAAKRFKGLGELQPNELREFYLDPNTRKLLQFTLDDAKDFLSLMSTETNDKNKLMESTGIITRQCIQI